MGRIDPQRSLGELVLEHPGVARIFEELGFDYCCGGKESLADAAAQRGLDPRTLAVVLEADARADAGDDGERDWREVPLAELCDHIVNEHHAFLRRELPRIGGLVEKVSARHEESMPALAQLQTEFEALHCDLIDHIDSEEQNLFPLCNGLDRDHEAQPGTAEQLLMHESAHTDVGQTLARMRELAGGYDRSAALCTTHGVLIDSLRALELDLHQHIHEENNILFPRLRGQLGQAAQVAVS